MQKIEGESIKEIKVVEISDKNVWESFLLRCEEKTFLQSWYWGEFQKMMGNKIWRWGIYEGDNLLAVVLVVKIQAKRGTFLLIQHGPTLVSSQENKLEILETLLKKLKEIGQKEKCAFVRLASLWEINGENQRIFKQLGFLKAPMHANAYEATWKLDLTGRNEEELLAQMRKTTRYLIRRALKNKEISIEKSENIDDFEKFNELNQIIAKKQRFTPFSREYLKNEFTVFSPEKKALWIFGKYQNKIVAGALVIFWSGIGFYHQGASLPAYAKLSLPYLIQWEAIKEAKRRGCRMYDFWGYVDPFKYPKHPWAGPTLFKMGFGGKSYQYLPTSDIPLSKRYWLIFVFEKLRKLKRGL